jgi:hypothetical protein
MTLERVQPLWDDYTLDSLTLKLLQSLRIKEYVEEQLNFSFHQLLVIFLLSHIPMKVKD